MSNRNTHCLARSQFSQYLFYENVKRVLYFIMNRLSHKKINDIQNLPAKYPYLDITCKPNRFLFWILSCFSLKSPVITFIWDNSSILLFRNKTIRHIEVRPIISKWSHFTHSLNTLALPYHFTKRSGVPQNHFSPPLFIEMSVVSQKSER